MESLLEAVNLLADGKEEKFRLLRNEPLVIEGDNQNIKLTNLWKLLGEEWESSHLNKTLGSVKI